MRCGWRRGFRATVWQDNAGGGMMRWMVLGVILALAGCGVPFVPLI